MFKKSKDSSVRSEQTLYWVYQSQQKHEKVHNILTNTSEFKHLLTFPGSACTVSKRKFCLEKHCRTLNMEIRDKVRASLWSPKQECLWWIWTEFLSSQPMNKILTFTLLISFFRGIRKLWKKCWAMWDQYLLYLRQNCIASVLCQTT